jgi:hypothetical protein
LGELNEVIQQCLQGDKRLGNAVNTYSRKVFNMAYRSPGVPRKLRT